MTYNVFGGTLNLTQSVTGRTSRDRCVCQLESTGVRESTHHRLRPVGQ